MSALDLFREDRERRRADLQHEIDDQRRNLARRAALPLAGITAAAMTTAAAAGSAMAPLTAILPAAAAIAAGVVSSTRVDNPKILAAEHDACYAGRKVLLGPWLGAVRKFAKARKIGDVLEAHTYAVAAKLAHYTRIGKGCARVTYKTLAFEVGCCRETIRKVIRSLEAAGLLVTENVMARVSGKRLWRVENSYLVRMADEIWPPVAGEPATGASDAPAAELSMARRMAKFAAYAAQFFVGLVARPTGLNATGLRGRPEPA